MRAAGERHGRSALTWASVNAIRIAYFKRWFTQQELAEQYGVRQNTIHRIISNYTWKK